MRPSKAPRVVIVTRPTEYEMLLARHPLDAAHGLWVGVDARFPASNRTGTPPLVELGVLANRVLQLVLAMAEGKQLGDLLFTTEGGSQLHRTATLRA